MGSIFRDADVEPTTAAIGRALGPRALVWGAIETTFADAGVPLTWRYYRDGGWLAKAVTGRRTIAWVAVEDGHVRVTFHVAERHRAGLGEVPELEPDTRERILGTELSGGPLSVTFEVSGLEQVVQVRAVLAFALSTR